MTYSNAIRRAVPCGLIGLFVGGYLASVLLAAGITSSNRTPQFQDWLSVPVAAFPLLAIALLFAAPVTLLIGCPLYAALLQRGYANFASTILIVLVIAAIAFLVTDPAISYLAGLYGAPIALITHAAQRVRSNKSFKPNPLRGSA